jgi:hypothetical protein
MSPGKRVNGTLVLVDAQTVSIESTRGEPPRVIERTAIVDVSPPADDVDRWGWAYLLVFPFILLLGKLMCGSSSDGC